MSDKDQSQQQALATIDPSGSAALAPMQDDPASFGFGGTLALWTSIDQTTDEGKALVLRCATGSADINPDDLLATPFNMTDILVHKVNLVSNESGEITEADRVVLVNDQKQTVSFVSAGVMNSLRYVFMLYGRPPFTKPLPIKLKSVRTRRGFKTYNLDVVIASAKK